MHDTTDRIQRSARKPPRVASRAEAWARSPVFVLRAGLVGTYVISAYVATMALIAGVPVFDMTTPAGWTVIWASSLLVASAAAALCASIDETNPSKEWRAAELISAGSVILLTASYSIALHILAFNGGDDARKVVAAVSLALFILPLARFAWLASQLGRTPYTPKSA